MIIITTILLLIAVFWVGVEVGFAMKARTITPSEPAYNEIKDFYK